MNTGCQSWWVNFMLPNFRKLVFFQTLVNFIAFTEVMSFSRDALKGPKISKNMTFLRFADLVMKQDAR